MLYQASKVWQNVSFSLTVPSCHIGPSGVRALPLAAGRNEGGHYFHCIFHLIYPAQASVHILCDLLPPLFKTTEGVVVLFQIFAWAPN